MTDEERKAWLDSLKPGDEVLHSECTAKYCLFTRAKVVAVYPDCFRVTLLYPTTEPGPGFHAEARTMFPRTGQRNAVAFTYRIDPMTDEARRRFDDDDRRAWVKANIRGQLDNLGSDDLRRVADLLGYKERAK